MRRFGTVPWRRNWLPQRRSSRQVGPTRLRTDHRHATALSPGTVRAVAALVGHRGTESGLTSRPESEADRWLPGRTNAESLDVIGLSAELIRRRAVRYQADVSARRERQGERVLRIGLRQSG